MRLHTTLTTEQVSDALTREKKNGRIASHVTFKALRDHRSSIYPYWPHKVQPRTIEEVRALIPAAVIS